jgi:predicted cupin superfamily sugar epimerase
MDAQALIERYGLQPHPEGGWYRELHRSRQAVVRADGQQRSGLTAILFLLEAGAVSRWHRVSRADETWHFAGGDPLELLVLQPGEGELQCHRLGPVSAAGGLSHDQDPELLEPLAVVPAGWWQAARSLGAWSLVSCCVGPGFDFADFTLLRDLPSEQHPPGARVEFL